MATGFSRDTHSRTSPHSSHHNLDSLTKKLGRHPEFRQIQHFYHVTDVRAKRSIIRTNKLCGSVAKLSQLPSTLSPIHNRLSGVFFNCNLSKKGSGLPGISPFGSERIRIPISKFASSNIRLFYNSHHTTKSKIYYVILVLVEKSNPMYKFCRNQMIDLDMASNPFLRLDFLNGSFECCHPTKFSLWVEIFVVGDVPLTGTNYKWDSVVETGRHNPAQRELYNGYDDESSDDESSDNEYSDEDGFYNDGNSSDDESNDNEYSDEDGSYNDGDSSDDDKSYDSDDDNFYDSDADYKARYYDEEDDMDYWDIDDYENDYR